MIGVGFHGTKSFSVFHVLGQGTVTVVSLYRFNKVSRKNTLIARVDLKYYDLAGYKLWFLRWFTRLENKKKL